jgi:hypothetical protein
MILNFTFKKQHRAVTIERNWEDQTQGSLKGIM